MGIRDRHFHFKRSGGNDVPEIIDSIHVREIGFVEATETEIWNYAKANSLTIVSKDTDFQQRSLLLGHPPKVVWLRVGNCPAKLVEDLLRKHSNSIQTFDLDTNKSYLVLS